VLLQYLPDPLLVVGEDRRILAVNAPAEALTGLRADEVVGQRTCQETIACHDRQGRRLCDACPHLAAAANRVTLSQSGVTVSDGAGRPVPVAATYFPLRGGAGEPRVDAIILAALTARGAAAAPDEGAALAGLYSRERFQASYTRERERAERFHSGLALVRVSVRARNAGGESAAPRRPSAADLDAAFHAVAQLLLRSVRAVDVVGRCDAHDCAILLPAASFAGTRALVTRLETHLAELVASGALPPTVELALGVTLAESYADLLARGGQRLAPIAPTE
jgi:PAS domain S-box-containing protein